MYCSYCGFNLQHETSFCSSCGKNIEFLFNVKQPSTSEAGGTGNFRSLKEKERQSCFKKKKETPRDNPVKISVGLMQQKDGVLKAVRGMVLPLVVKPGLDAEHLLEAAEQKMKDVNKNLRGGPYLLLYPDGTKVTCIPGTETPFSLKLYKEAVGKAYQRITLYICTADDYYNKSQLSDSDSSDSEVITSRSTAEVNSADTVIFEPNSNSTTNDVGGSSPDDLAAPYTGTSRNLMDTTCYSKCTQPYVPIVIKEEEDLGSDANSDAISKDTELEEQSVTEVVAHLALQINLHAVSRFNICPLTSSSVIKVIPLSPFAFLLCLFASVLLFCFRCRYLA